MSGLDFFHNDRAIKKPQNNKAPKVKKVEETRVSNETIEEVQRTTPAKPKERYVAQPKPEQRFYPERTFDKYITKKIQINDGTFSFLSDLERMVSRAKQELPREERTLKRVTTNTIIREALDLVADTLENAILNGKVDYYSLTNEDNVSHELRKLFKRDLITRKE